MPLGPSTGHGRIRPPGTGGIVPEAFRAHRGAWGPRPGAYVASPWRAEFWSPAFPSAPEAASAAADAEAAYTLQSGILEEQQAAATGAASYPTRGASIGAIRTDVPATQGRWSEGLTLVVPRRRPSSAPPDSRESYYDRIAATAMIAAAAAAIRTAGPVAPAAPLRAPVPTPLEGFEGSHQQEQRAELLCTATAPRPRAGTAAAPGASMARSREAGGPLGALGPGLGQQWLVPGRVLAIQGGVPPSGRRQPRKKKRR
mmetsp:Transcript_52558/g.168497  ORF Transcript_52558/g.168497 Transcript_52558/m.168497 type:complete len:257 (-) Transcript_52558:94-864(-)